MKKQNSFTIVIFGATGNLYTDKLAKALYLLFLEGKLPTDFNIIAFARRDLSDQDFRIFTRENILKRGKIDVSKLDGFLEHVVYFKGDFLEKDDFVKLKDFISKSSSMDTNRQVLLHIATASQQYEKIFKNIQVSGLNNLNEGTKILIEKPFGKDELDAKYLQGVLATIFKEENIFHTDHYLAKETVQKIFDFRWKGNLPEDKCNQKYIKKIKIIFHESNVVGSRGMFYDVVGAFRDVGQNHMLELLATVIMDKPTQFNAENIRISRQNSLCDLYLDQEERIKQKIIRAQYDEYHLESGVDSNSETETFFRVLLRSKNLNFLNVIFELEGGKGLIDMHSDITTTTVAIEIYFNNGEKKELKIQPVAGTVYESYTRVYDDAIKGDQTNFPSIEEIITEWKLTDELLKKWKNTPLLIYKKGSKAEDIK